jgi:hypothetical protein
MSLSSSRNDAEGVVLMKHSGTYRGVARSARLAAPHITLMELLKQSKSDITGKEVQSAATYSYTWTADQVGHICIGMVLNCIVTFFAAKIPPLFFHHISEWTANLVGLAGAALIATLWEVHAYYSCVAQATGRFPLDKTLLRNNALIAIVYMAMGAVVVFGFTQPGLWPVWTLLSVFCIALICARPWLRQKIIWQKAALPYLFRLADANGKSISKTAASVLQTLIDQGVPPKAPARQVVIGGPIGSGRSSLATGIGTEFAFRNAKVRYLSFAALLEFSMAIDKLRESKFPEDSGPKNIRYWAWNEAQVLIIDDIGPVIGSQHAKTWIDQFRSLLALELYPIAEIVARCHTVWILGNRSGNQTTLTPDVALAPFAAAIAEFCESRCDPLIVELEENEAPVVGSVSDAAVRRGAATLDHAT